MKNEEPRKETRSAGASEESISDRLPLDGFAARSLRPERLDCRRERWHFRLDDVPHDVRVDAEVFVDEDVTQPGDPLPLHVRDALPRNSGDTFLAASPMISRLRTTASIVLSSARKLSIVIPDV